MVGTVQTSKPILKARVARTGVVAAILQDNDKTWVNFYAKDGSLIAENQTRIDSPGYPVDIAVSPNGKIIMVSYLYVEDAQTTSYVAFIILETAVKVRLTILYPVTLIKMSLYRRPFI